MYVFFIHAMLFASDMISDALFFWKKKQKQK